MLQRLAAERPNLTSLNGLATTIQRGLPGLTRANLSCLWLVSSRHLWSDIALSVKEKASWRCHHCHRQCLRPGEKPKELTRSEWTKATLCVHHANFIPEDNRPENLIPLCMPCHLAMHTRGKGNISPGQLSLFSLLRSDWLDPQLQQSELSCESFKTFDNNLADDSSFVTNFPQ